MKIFITGPTGFIGKYVVEKLREDKNNELFLLSKDLADIENWKTEVKNFKPDAAIHLAWEGLPDYGAKNSIKNLNYGLNLMNFLAEINCKTVIMAGTCWEVLPQPVNAMSAAKTALHWLGEEIAKEKNMNFIWARFFYVYGPGQREDSLIPFLIRCKKNGDKPKIKTPEAKKDFIYVGDVAEALSKIIKKGKKRAIYDIGSGKLTGVQEIAKIIFPDFKIKKLKKDSAGSPLADISKIKKEIGWEPETGIKEGIKKIIKQ
jgi:nucleoside-diphosphate-sugar epimerase